MFLLLVYKLLSYFLMKGEGVTQCHNYVFLTFGTDFVGYKINYIKLLYP